MGRKQSDTNNKLHATLGPQREPVEATLASAKDRA